MKDTQAIRNQIDKTSLEIRCEILGLQLDIILLKLVQISVYRPLAFYEC